MTPSKSSSRTGSRRNRAALAVLFLLCAACAGGQSLALTAGRDGGDITAGLAFRWDHQPELAASLRDGLESRITFTLRVYQERTGLARILGGKLIATRSISRSAFWDFLDGRFVIESDTGERASYTRTDTLLAQYFALASVPVCPYDPDSHSSYTVIARVQLDPVRLVPPLNLVSIAGVAARYTSHWARAEIPAAGGAQ